MARPSVSPEEFALIAGYLRDACGLDLDQSKEYLVKGRLEPLLATERCASYFELYQRTRADSTGRLARLLVDAIATKETFFFREPLHFHLLRQRLLPALAARAQTPGGPAGLAIWSAGCATGQEAYSLAIAVHETLGDQTAGQVRIVGTDIAESALARAQAGLYTSSEVGRGLSSEETQRYLQPAGGQWQVCERLRQYVSFRRLNLIEVPPDWGRFDLIMCRNVGIYFSPQGRRTLFERLADHLRPHGILIVGSTESLVGLSDRFQIEWDCGTSYYRLRRG
jgi:chemotaxis protein methyltransferase CheR